MSVLTLADVATGRKNNITFIRLVAALMVIWGHSNAVVRQPGQDLVSYVTQYAHAGGLAVDMFFLMSGFLVTGSIINGGLRRYVVSRALRIYPALWVCLIVVTFVLGAALTALPLGQYLGDAQTWRYFGRLASGMWTEWFLPGVFQQQRDHAVNGSIWSIIVEIRMYVLLAALFVLRVYRWPAVFNALFVFAMILGYREVVHFPYFASGSTDLQVASYFAIGSFLYVNRQWIPAGPFPFFVTLVIAATQIGTPGFPLVYALVLTTLFIWTAFGQQFHWMDKHDYSYGIYLYGWPVQQAFVYFYPDMSAHQNMVASMVVATALGALSWHFVEAPMLGLKRYFDRRKDALRHEDVLPRGGPA